MARDKRYKLIRNFNSIEVVDSNLGNNPFINSFAKIAAESFPNIPYEELYDLEKDPYQKVNLINNKPSKQNFKWHYRIFVSNNIKFLWSILVHLA
mgnify:CR=1 FL=1